jgi:hypothetical protein
LGPTRPAGIGGRGLSGQDLPLGGMWKSKGAEKRWWWTKIVKNLCPLPLFDQNNDCPDHLKIFYDQ